MGSIKSERMTVGFCLQCRSDVEQANRIYFCGCGSTSDESYDSPPNWVFKPSGVSKPLSYKVAADAAQLC